eukprot:CAMPEP_0194319360 /NCGR_PEP_ID=MMETSP0171-20130528/15825_1 /TAXON_ID=218684 /ORGANISM="Corethron pennatum, Strain L29A3" /LENGTH=151 /DNA_ID=CAMNT_0039076549 /DNA_START=72 /DNA_END=524 /DNA_ORIENTATION=-
MYMCGISLDKFVLGVNTIPTKFEIIFEMFRLSREVLYHPDFVCIIFLHRQTLLLLFPRNVGVPLYVLGAHLLLLESLSHIVQIGLHSVRRSEALHVDVAVGERAPFEPRFSLEAGVQLLRKILLARETELPVVAHGQEDVDRIPARDVQLQ